MKRKIIFSCAMILIIVGCIFFIQSTSNAADKDGNFVIVLDPGHGGNDSGAINSTLGIREADVNYKLAIYAKAELERYEGVKVYLTRYANCPSIYERAEFAKNYNADLVVSMHINSGAKNARGAEIWVTQDDTKVEYYERSKDLGQKILWHINQLGVRNNGVSTRSGKADEWYSSGVVKDYYGIIRYAMNYDIRSILVEHCFISNNNDCQYINSDAKIKQLAIADVKGIVEAYQLQLKGNRMISVSSMRLDKNDINLEITDQEPQPVGYLNPIFSPLNVSNSGVDYYSSDSSVVRVYNGKIRGLKEGKATITAISWNNQRISKANVIVTKPQVALKDIKIDQEKRVINVNEKGSIKVEFTPSNASDKTMYWTTDNPEVLRIYNEDFRGLKEGKATVTGYSRAGGKVVSCEITVRDNSKNYVKEIKLPYENYEAYIDEAMDIKFDYTPTDSINADFEWTTNNPDVIRVWGPRFRALKEGTAEVIARTKDGTVEARMKVTVKSNTIEKMEFEEKTKTVKINEAGKLKIKFTPDTGINKKVYWQSSNPKIVRVYEGDFRGLEEGTSIITATTEDGKSLAKCEIIVKDMENIKVKDINTEKEKYIININEKSNIAIKFTPDNATNKKLIWECSDPEVVRVYNGDFRGLKEGIAKITIMTEDKIQQTTCYVIVRNPNKKYVENIKLPFSTYTAKINEAVDIDFNYQPIDSSNAEFEWSSSNNEILRVWGPRFRALKEGTAKVIVKTKDGTIIEKIKIIIKE